MKDISARDLKGHKILAVERFKDSTRWMIEFVVLRPCSAWVIGLIIGCAHDRVIMSDLLIELSSM